MRVYKNESSRRALLPSTPLPHALPANQALPSLYELRHGAKGNAPKNAGLHTHRKLNKAPRKHMSCKAEATPPMRPPPPKKIRTAESMHHIKEYFAL